MKITYLIIVIIIISIFILLSQRYLINNYLKIKTTPEKLKIDLSFQDKEYFRDKKVIICGLARDITNNLNYLKQNLNTLVGLFEDYIIVIVENDSKDNTRKMLFDLKKEFKIVLLGCGIDSPECKMNTKKYSHDRSRIRIQKMVDLRNIYMDYINKISPGEYDFVMMIDFDIAGIIYEDGLLNSAYYFSKFPEIDMVASNSILLKPLNIFFERYYYYDQYAMIPSKKYINFKDIPVGEKSDLFIVESAFGGLGIYRFNSLYGLKYSYENDSKGVPLCEHVVFHKNIQNKFINPKMLFMLIKN